MKFEHRYLCGHMFSFILDKFLEMDLLGGIARVGLTLQDIAVFFPKVAALVCIPSSTWHQVFF